MEISHKSKYTFIYIFKFYSKKVCSILFLKMSMESYNIHLLVKADTTFKKYFLSIFPWSSPGDKITPFSDL